MFGTGKLVNFFSLYISEYASSQDYARKTCKGGSFVYSAKCCSNVCIFYVILSQYCEVVTDIVKFTRVSLNSLKIRGLFLSVIVTKFVNVNTLCSL